MAKSQCTRDDLKQHKDSLRVIAKDLRVMARALGHDRKLQDLVERAAENAEDARALIKLGPTPRKPKEAPYRGGGTWHPAGMMPGGRRRSEVTSESW